MAADVPDESRTFTDEGRAAATADLLVDVVQLSRWVEATERDLWPDELEDLGRDLQPGDSVELKLQRWVNLFEPEIHEVIRARNRLTHGMTLSDGELGSALWLAEQLLGYLTAGSPTSP